MAKKVLILTCEAGGGHRSVTKALGDALEHLFPGKYHFLPADIVADCFPFPLNTAGRAYGPVVNLLPRTWGVVWHLSNGPRRSPLPLGAIAPLASGRLDTILHEIQPDIVVSTHPFANHLPVRLLRQAGWETPLVTVVTDLVTIHQCWLCPEVDLCLVATEEARQTALLAGLPTGRVEVVGLPVGLEFHQRTRGKEELRSELNLNTERVTILVMGGGDGMGNVFSSARAAAQAAPGVQLVIVAGRSPTLKARLEAVSWEVPTTILGFVDNMADLMQAADLLITKAGPSTISEALACGLPMLISGALRGQEEGNVDWAVETGAALAASNPQEIGSTLQTVLGAGRRVLREMSHAAQATRP
ncbi:MAG: glycosyltransferase, partial [Anaerolineae bacterium]|nr:glycosyltransferase [Anaerolineae bacterium]